MVKRVSPKQEEEKLPEDINPEVIETVEINIPDGVALKSVEHPGSKFYEPELTQKELTTIRWELFGVCPHCHFNVKGWSSGPFNAAQYSEWRDNGVDALTGHSLTCEHKYLRSP